MSGRAVRPAHRATTRTEQPEPPVDTEEDLARVESQLAAMQDEPAPEFYAAVRCDGEQDQQHEQHGAISASPNSSGVILQVRSEAIADARVQLYLVAAVY